MFKSTYKSLIVLSMLVLILISWQACDDSVLNQEPQGFTEATYFASESDFQEAVVAVYAKLTDLYYFGSNEPKHPVWLLPGDAVTTEAGLDYEVFEPLSPDDGRLSYVWNTYYVLKNRANVVLTKIETDGDVYIDENLKNYHEGEALFLRSWAMFRLWNHWGAFAPLVDQRITATEGSLEPESSNPNDPWGTELLDKAIDDLQRSAELLPASWPEEDLGRLTSNSAYGLLGKALVFRASITGNDADYESAISAFNNIEGRSLVTHYRDVSSQFSENNEESLFEFQAEQAPDMDNVWLNNDFDISVGPMSSYWGFYSDGPNWFESAPLIPTEKLLNTYEEGDPRADWTVGPMDEPITERNRYRKYVFDENKANSGVGSLNNPRILRYADVLLLEAEAHLETGDLTQAIELINQIRERARNTGDTPSANPADRPLNEANPDVVFDWMQEERFIELAGEEAHRWFDLRRWHKAGKIDLNNFDFSSVREEAFNIQLPKHLFYPIPQSELDANRNIEQNDGY